VSGTTANRNYYADLYEAEKGGARWIGENDSVFVLATFAPRGFNEVPPIEDMRKRARGLSTRL
jgi:galactose-1-phosphate uridylyltransferase